MARSAQAGTRAGDETCSQALFRFDRAGQRRSHSQHRLFASKEADTLAACGIPSRLWRGKDLRAEGVFL